jgi:hypothetical protein
MAYRVGQELEQKAREAVGRTISKLELDELIELQDWLDEKREADRQALIKSISALISDMRVEALEELEISLAESD